MGMGREAECRVIFLFLLQNVLREWVAFPLAEEHFSHRGHPTRGRVE